GKAQVLVEIVPPEPYTCIGQDIARTVRFAGMVGGQTDDRKIGSPAAEVHDDSKFLRRNPRFMGKSSSDRLKLKSYMLETQAHCYRPQFVFSPLVSGRIVIGEMHRPTHDDMPEFDTGVRFCFALHLVQEGGYDLVKFHQLTIYHG